MQNPQNNSTMQDSVKKPVPSGPSQDSSQNQKKNAYYEQGKMRRTVDFFIGFIGSLVLLILTTFSGIVFFVLYPSLCVLATVFSFYNGRRFIGFGILSFMHFYSLIFGTYMLMLV